MFYSFIFLYFNFMLINPQNNNYREDNYEL